MRKRSPSPIKGRSSVCPAVATWPGNLRMAQGTLTAGEGPASLPKPLWWGPGWGRRQVASGVVAEGCLVIWARPTEMVSLPHRSLVEGQ